MEVIQYTHRLDYRTDERGLLFPGLTVEEAESSLAVPARVRSVIVRASLDMGFAILTAAALGFLGLGAQEPTPEWGAMVSDSRKTFPAAWWSATFPGLSIFVTVFAFNLLGDGLRDVLDPRTRD